jgi:hypothetical protein
LVSEIKENIMGIAANKFRLLFLTASKSDIEYKIFLLNQKRMALMDSAENIARNFSNGIFDSGQHSDLYDGQMPGIFPWMGGSNPSLPEDPVPTGDYEAQMAVIHAMDKEYEMEVKKLETFHEAKKTEIDSVREILKKNTEKDYKTFG